MPDSIEQALEQLLRDRQTLASTLHDDIAQSLTLAVLSLKRMAAAPPQQMALAALDEAVGQVRGATVALRPSLLDQAGLLPALRLYCESEWGRVLQTEGELDTSTWTDAQRGRWYWACQQLLLIGDTVTTVVADTSPSGPRLGFLPWNSSPDAVGWLSDLGLVAAQEDDRLWVSAGPNG